MSIPWWFPLCFLKEQWVLSLHHPTTSFSGQTIIITGANSGIGLEAARHFVKLNASKIILAVHSAEKGELAKTDLQNSLCTPCTTSIEIWPLDLCSFDSVKQFAERARKELPRLDTLLCNAGIHALHWNIVEATGHETTITTNVLSPFILALLLLPLLKATAEIHNARTRLTFADSEMHFASTLSERLDPSGSIFNTLRDKAKWDRHGRYNASKLIQVLTVRELTSQEARALYNIIINSVNPGLC